MSINLTKLLPISVLFGLAACTRYDTTSSTKLLKQPLPKGILFTTSKTIGGIHFEMLSDFHPHGGVARSYGVMRDDGISERALIVVDKAGTVVWTKVYAIPEQPDLSELFGVLESLSGRR